MAQLNAGYALLFIPFIATNMLLFKALSVSVPAQGGDGKGSGKNFEDLRLKFFPSNGKLGGNYQAAKPGEDFRPITD